MRKSNVVAYFLLSFIVGVALRSFVSFDPFILFMVVGVGVVGAVVLFSLVRDKTSTTYQTYKSDRFYKTYKLKFLPWLLLGPIFIFLGFLRFESGLLASCENNENSIKCLSGQIVEIEGLITAEPDIRERNIQYKLAVENYEGNILVFGPSFPEYSYGDELKMKCRLAEPEFIEDFDYPGFLAKEGVYSICFNPQAVEKVLSNNYSLLTVKGVTQRLIDLKSDFKQTIDRAVSFPQSSFLGSILLGLRRGVPSDIQDNFSATGTSHLMAISGLHIVILINIFFFLFRGLHVPKKKAVWFALVLIILFIGLIGFRASAVRAGIFGAVAILAFASGRPRHALNLLLLAAAVLLIVNPLLLRFDVGFQLSFLAVLGLAYLSPYFKKWFDWVPNWEYLPWRDILVMTLSAQVFVLPWILYQFGNLSIIAPLANILVLPVVPFIMGFGFGLIILGSLWFPLAQVIGFVEFILIGYVLKITELLAVVPLASWQVSLPLWGAGLIYLVLISILANRKVREKIVNIWFTFVNLFKPKPRLAVEKGVTTETLNIEELESIKVNNAIASEAKQSKDHFLRHLVGAAMTIKDKLVSYISRISLIGRISLISLIVIFLLLVGSLLVGHSKSELKAIFFDVGQGDAHLIMAPGGQNILIDGGPDNTVLEKLSKYLPAGSKTIDLMVLTHPHADHVAGLIEVLRRYDVKRVLATQVGYETSEYVQWLELVEQEGAVFDAAAVPKRYEFESSGEPVILDLLYPFENLAGQMSEDPNISSVVLLLDYQDTEMLFTGDVYVEAEEQLTKSGSLQEVEILKVAHHGSDTSSAQGFLEALDPEYAVISVGENYYGHPSRLIVRRIERTGAQVLRTDENGDIVFTSDGFDLQLKQ